MEQSSINAPAPSHGGQPRHPSSSSPSTRPHQPQPPPPPQTATTTATIPGNSTSGSTSNNPLFQLHHPDASRPYPIRTMSSSAAQSPFFQSTRRGSQPYTIAISTSGNNVNTGGIMPGTSTSSSVPREQGNSPDSVSSTASGARFGVIGGSPTGHSTGINAAATTGAGIPAGSGSTTGQGVRWGGSGLRNTLARGSTGGWGAPPQGTFGMGLGLGPGGTVTRSSSFSGRETRSPRLVDEMPSHVEESWLDKYKSSSSPFPTFSDTSSPPGSPPLPQARLLVGIGGGADRRDSAVGAQRNVSYNDHHHDLDHEHEHADQHHTRPHSPPRAEANVSRSRSQSMAPGVLRPQFSAHHHHHHGGAGFGNGLFGGGVLHGLTGIDAPSGMGNGMTTTATAMGGGASRGFGMGESVNSNSPWADQRMRSLLPDESATTSSSSFRDPSNMSPFGARHGGYTTTSTLTTGGATDSKLGIPGEGRRFVHGQDTYSGSAEKYNDPTHETLTSSVHAALAGFDPYAAQTTTKTATTHDRYAIAGPGGGLGNGGQSGSSSRRHSISVAGGPSARRGFQIPGFGFSEALVSPEIETKFPLHGIEHNVQGQMQGRSFAHTSTSVGTRGRQTGFSDADLLAADLGNGLSLHHEPGQGAFRQSSAGTATRDSSSASMRDEARSRFDGAAVPNDNNNRDWQVGASPFVPGYGATFVPRNVNAVGQMGQPFASNHAGGYGSFAPPRINGGISNGHFGGQGNAGPYQNFQQGRPNDYSGGRPQQQQLQQYHQQQQQPQQQHPHQLYAQPAKMSPFAPGQAPSFVGSIGSGPAPITNQAMNDMGKGVPVQMLNPATRLFIVEFKAGRTDLFYTPDPTVTLQLGDLVIVEADRGQDLGKVKEDKITVDDVRSFNLARKQEMDVHVHGAMSARIKGALTNILVGEANVEAGVNGPNPNPAVKAVQRELMPKRIFGKAGPADRQLLTAKLQDEAQALALCQQRVKQKRLPMEVLDAEYQWDRRKLTFYFIAEKRIDFRELVRELFRIHKTRIWMASLDHSYLQDDENKS